MGQRISNSSVASAIAAVVLATVFGSGHLVWSQDGLTTPAPDQGRIEGIVTDAESGDPVPGVRVIYRFDYERPDAPGTSSVEAVTQADGRYSLAVPFGDYLTFEIRPPAGYLRDDEHSPKMIFEREGRMPTRQEPVQTVNWSVTQGTRWRVSTGGVATGSPLTLYVTTDGDEKKIGLHSAKIDGEGNAVFTLPKSQCEVVLEPVKSMWEPFSLTVETGFLPELATAITTEEHVTVIRDRDGRTAKLTNASATIDEQGLRFHLVKREGKKHKIKGLVRDANGNVVEDAVVRVFLHLPQGVGGILQYWTRSRKDGSFLIPDVFIGNDHCLIQCEASSPGFSPAKSKSVSVDPSTISEIEVGGVELRPGRSIPVKVVDPLGRPVEGAIVRLSGTDHIFRTDSQGKCDLKDLTLNECELKVYHGRQSTSAVLSSSIIADRQTEILLTLGDIYTQKFGVDGKTPPKLRPVASGTPAPELQIQEWTDGRPRSLKDFKGKVVVLFFWNPAAGFCAEELTIISNLEKTFEGRGVEFLGIHVPTGDAQSVRDLMAQQDWEIPTGIDRASANHAGSGQTAAAYGIQEMSFVVIGKDGRISLNWETLVDDEATRAIFIEAANALGIPLDNEGNPKDDGSESCEPCARIMEYVKAKAIEAALNQ